jgi:hypothetical protein
MTVTQPRYRIVTFRLSLQEYEIAFAGCEAEGAHSMSEYARAAVLARARRLLQLGSAADAPDPDFAPLQDRIDALIEALRQVSPHAAEGRK